MPKTEDSLHSKTKQSKNSTEEGRREVEHRHFKKTWSQHYTSKTSQHSSTTKVNETGKLGIES